MANKTVQLQDNSGNNIYPIPAPEDFKTINGETIKGTGNIDIAEVLSDGSIKSNKIDWTTFYRSAPTLSGDVTTTASTDTVIQTMTLPAGKWRVSFMVRGYISGTSNIINTAKIFNGNSEVYSVPNSWTLADNIRGQTVGSTELTLTSDTTITTRFNASRSASIGTASYLYAFRIG